MVHKNCICCTIQPFLEVSKWFAGPSGTIECIPNNTTSIVIRYQFSKIQYAIMLMIFCCLTVGCGYYVTVLKNEFTTAFNVPWLVSFIFFLECVKSGNALLHSLIKVNFFYVSVKALQAIVDLHVYASSDDVLPITKIKKLRNKIMVYTIGLIAVVIIQLLLWEKDQSHVLLKFVNALSLLISITFLTYYKLFCDLYNYFASFCYVELKIILTESENFQRKLNILLNSYKRINHTFNYYNRMMDGGVLVWSGATLVSNIIILSILVILSTKEMELVSFIMNTSGIYVTYALVLIFSCGAEKLYTENYRTMSFLYKYRACRFGPERVSQVTSTN
ncbi:hypothetical protein FQR65_LT12246 [Abscondita terminalis]|nr:hypothetical protein FQR65_LT12246 [Abscondita terminalis]